MNPQWKFKFIHVRKLRAKLEWFT